MDAEQLGVWAILINVVLRERARVRACACVRFRAWSLSRLASEGASSRPTEATTENNVKKRQGR